MLNPAFVVKFLNLKVQLIASLMLRNQTCRHGVGSVQSSNTSRANHTKLGSLYLSHWGEKRPKKKHVEYMSPSTAPITDNMTVMHVFKISQEHRRHLLLLDRPTQLSHLIQLLLKPTRYCGHIPRDSRVL